MENTLENFNGWQDSAIESDFFGDIPETEEVVAKDAEVKEEESQKKEETKSVKKEVDFFEKAESIENIIEKEKSFEAKSSINVSILNTLMDKGFIDYKLEEGQELTEDLAENLIEEKIEETIDNRVKELLNDLPDLTKQLIQFSIKGGDIKDFMAAVDTDTSINTEIDLNNEDNQIKILKQLLRLEDKDEEEIEAEIDFLQNSNKLKLISEKKLGKYKAEIKVRQQEVLEEQREEFEEQKRLIKEAKTKISFVLDAQEDLDGIKITKEDRKGIPSYMNDKTVKLQNGTVITEMQKELFYELPKNQTTLIQLALLLKNRNKDGSFNFDDIAKSVKTKVTQEVKDNVRRNKTSIHGNSQTQVKQSEKSLADYFS